MFTELSIISTAGEKKKPNKPNQKKPPKKQPTKQRKPKQNHQKTQETRKSQKAPNWELWITIIMVPNSAFGNKIMLSVLPITKCDILPSVLIFFSM